MIKDLFIKGLTCLSFCSMAVPVMAEELYWTFTDDQEPVPMTAECDAYFDEVRGGVFVPTTEAVYTKGVEFLNSDVEAVRRRAGYCFLVAALAGHTKAQLELARMYSEGKYLPQDDLSAYKWSMIAAIDGNDKNAEKFALTLEQFLSNDDLNATTVPIMDMRGKIEQARKAKEEAAKAELLEKQQDQEKAQIAADAGEGIVAPNSVLPIFSEEDRLK